MTARLRCRTMPTFCVTYSPGWRDRRMPKTLPLLSNLSCPFPTKPLVHMMQRVTDWVSIPLLFPSNSSILPLHLRTLLTPRKDSSYISYFFLLFLLLRTLLTCTKIGVIIIASKLRLIKPTNWSWGLFKQTIFLEKPDFLFTVQFK